MPPAPTTTTGPNTDVVHDAGDKLKATVQHLRDQHALDARARRVRARIAR